MTYNINGRKYFPKIVIFSLFCKLFQIYIILNLIELVDKRIKIFILPIKNSNIIVKYF